MTKLKCLLLFCSLCVFTSFGGAEETEEMPRDPAVVQICGKVNHFLQCSGTGVFISDHQVLTAYHVVSPILQTKNSINGFLFFRHPKRPHVTIKFNKIIVASAIDDVAVLEVTDYASEYFYSLPARGENNTPITDQEVVLEGFPVRMNSRFFSLSTSVADSNQYHSDYYVLAKIPDEYRLRGMSGGPMLIDNRLVGIVSRESSSYAYVALVNQDKIDSFEFCDDDSSCVKKSMQALQEEAANGNSIAQYLLFMKYRSGMEIKQDIAQAFNWYNQALSQGYSEEEE